MFEINDKVFCIEEQLWRNSPFSVAGTIICDSSQPKPPNMEHHQFYSKHRNTPMRMFRVQPGRVGAIPFDTDGSSIYSLPPSCKKCGQFEGLGEICIGKNLDESDCPSDFPLTVPAGGWYKFELNGVVHRSTIK